MDKQWTVFGERLRAELKRQGMSYRTFSAKVGLTLTTVYRYAVSERVPRASEILKTAKVLGVTCDYLIGLSDDPHKTSKNEWVAEQQEEAIPVAWIEAKITRLIAMDNEFAGLTAHVIKTLLNEWRDEKNGTD